MLFIKKSKKCGYYKKSDSPLYSSKKYSNPFFSKKRRRISSISRNSLPLKAKVTIILILIIVILMCWFLFYSRYFNIDQITISGEGRIPESSVEDLIRQQIENNLYVFFPQINIFLFNDKKLDKTLRKKYSFDSLIIEKKLPSKLTVNYKEKEYSVIWNENENYYYADFNGVIITETNLLEIKDKEYPIITNESNKKIYDNAIKVESEYIGFAINLFSSLKKYNNEFIIEKFLINDKLNTVTLVIKDGPLVFFNINESVEKQIEKLLVIKNERIKDNFNTKTYIDLRIGDNVYYL